MTVAGSVSVGEASPVTCAHDNTIFSKMKCTFCTNYSIRFLMIRPPPSHLQRFLTRDFPCHPSDFSIFSRFTPHFVDLFPPFPAQITKIRRCFHLFVVRRFAQSLFSLSFLPCCFQHLPCLRLLSFLHCFGIAFPSAFWYNNPHRIALWFSHHFIYLRK